MVTDINGIEIEPGSIVKRHALIGKKCEIPPVRTVESIAPMAPGCEPMIWFKGGGGAHHPKAVEVITEDLPQAGEAWIYENGNAYRVMGLVMVKNYKHGTEGGWSKSVSYISPPETPLRNSVYVRELSEFLDKFTRTTDG